MSNHDAQQAWYAVAWAMELEKRDSDVSDAALLPTDLFGHIEPAHLDGDFDGEHEELEIRVSVVRFRPWPPSISEG